jgi:hypothetical protein
MNMFDNENQNPVGETIYEDTAQTPLQPLPEEAPEVAEATSADSAKSIGQQKYADNDRKRTEEVNWAELRRIQEQKDRELDFMRREIEQLRQSQKQKEDIGIPKDAFTEVQHVEKIIEARLRERDEQYRKQLESERQLHAERSLTAQYKDLYQVLSHENLRRLEMEEPEIAASIAANPDVYSAKVAAYKQIKKLGIAEESFNNQRVQERLAQNSQRPKNPAALAPRQGSQALQAAPATTGFSETITDDMAARYRKEMEDAIARM